MNWELPDIQAGFRKARGTREQTVNIPWVTEKSKRVPEKHLLWLCWLCQCLFRCRSLQTGKFWKRWRYKTTLPASWQISLQIKKQLGPDVEQWTGSKLGKENVTMVYCHSAYLTYMQSTCCRNPASIPGLGRFPGEGKGYPLQDSGLENSMDGMELVSGVAKSWTRLSSVHFHFSSC